jgi:hypothetical protein
MQLLLIRRPDTLDSEWPQEELDELIHYLKEEGI